jgi:GDP-4-dehydro-6-deoxy-D-mannose reductase
MRILVTGATGFVGRWLIRELEAAGHDAVPSPGSAELDITDEPAVTRFVTTMRPNAIAHLAGISYARDAARDPDRAMAVNEAGTAAVMRAAAALDPTPVVLVSGSSEVYGLPRPEDLPLREEAPLRAAMPYGRSKLAQERTALALGRSEAVPVIVTRSFNHTGPGQRHDFVAPALAQRVLEARRTGRERVPVGNLDVTRDIADVRDVVRAYRLLMEGVANGSVASGTVVNVATGKAVTIRWVFETICRIVGVTMRPEVDPSLLRPDDPPVVVGDPARLTRLTGWTATIPLEQTLRDLVTSFD